MVPIHGGVFPTRDSVALDGCTLWLPTPRIAMAASNAETCDTPDKKPGKMKTKGLFFFFTAFVTSVRGEHDSDQLSAESFTPACKCVRLSTKVLSII
jgi:hypothetical protein